MSTLAIISNLTLKGFSTENILDAIKDIAGLIVVVAVFLIASKLFSFNKKKGFSFNEKFEEYLLEWAKCNRYLIDTSEIKMPKGGKNLRTIDMIYNHASMINCNDASTVSTKGSFLYLPKSESLGNIEKENNEFSFKINKSMFECNPAIFDNYDAKKSVVTQQIASSIKMEFNSIGLNAHSSGDRIIVDFSLLDKTEENARRLIDVVEFVKTLFLAIA